MSGKNKLVLSVAVVSMTGMLTCTATLSQPQIRQTEGTTQIETSGTAGIAAVLSPERMNEILAQELTIEKNDIYKVSASMTAQESEEEGKEADAQTDSGLDEGKEKETDKDKKTEKTDTTEKEKKTEKTKKTDIDKKTEKTKKSEKQDSKDLLETIHETEEKDETAEVKAEAKHEKETGEKQKVSAKAKKWKQKLMADVDDYLNIRETADVNSKIVGKLYKGDVAKVINKGKNWTRIKSGSVTGCVKNEYCVYGLKAYKLAKKTCETYATVLTDGLRIRKEANENATILSVAEEGEKLVVNVKAKEKDGWVVVKCDGKNAYVSSQYVKVALGTGKAISIAEEQAQLAAKKKAEQAAQAAISNSTVSSTQNSVQAASSDLTLLSAIIFCEAGGESYAGQVAVGAVVMNRVKSSSYPNTISGVVYQSGQFSPVANGALSRALSNGNYQNCVSAARAALSGSDNTGGAKFFHRANGAAGLVIGNHVFY